MRLDKGKTTTGKKKRKKKGNQSSIYNNISFISTNLSMDVTNFHKTKFKHACRDHNIYLHTNSSNNRFSFIILLFKILFQEV